MSVKMGNVAKRVLITSTVALHVRLRFVHFTTDLHKTTTGDDHSAVGILEEKKKYGKEITNLHLQQSKCVGDTQK